MTSLDDLLSYDPTPKRRRRRRSPRARVVIRLVVSLILTLVAWRLLLAFGVSAPYPLLIAVVLTMNGLKAILDRVAPPPLPATLRDAPPSAALAVSREDGIRIAVQRWETRIEWTYDDLARFSTVVQPAVADLVDERLRLRHSVSRTADPERARQLVGPQLWAFIHEPVTQPVKPQEFATLVAQMEAV